MDRILNGNYLDQIPKIVDSINFALLTLVVIAWSIGLILAIVAIVRKKKGLGHGPRNNTGD